MNGPIERASSVAAPARSRSIAVYSLSLVVGLVLPAVGAALTRSPQHRLLALGDSYTIGEGVGAGERWPEQMTALLAARGVALAPPQVIARTGWTTSQLDAAVAEAAPRGHYALVSLMIGVNNQYRGLPIADYQREFSALLERALAFAGGEPRRVLVLSIPDYGGTPYARRRGLDGARVAAEIDRFNGAARSATELAGAAWIDVTPASRRAGSEPALLVSDELHPSAKLHAEWAAQALPAALAALQSEESPR